MQLLPRLLACVLRSGCCWVIIWLCVWSRLQPRCGTIGKNQQLTFVTPICSFLNFSSGLMSRSDAFWTCRGTVIKDQGSHSNQTANTLPYMCIKGIKVLGWWSSFQKGNFEVELRRRQSKMCVSAERVNCWSCNSCWTFKCFWVNK